MVSDGEHRAVVEFLYQEGRLADEARYAEWHALWTDDGEYWVPATTDPDADPDKQISHIYDNRARIDTRVKLLLGRTIHRLRPVDGALKMSRRKVVLVNAAEPLPNLSFLIW